MTVNTIKVNIHHINGHFGLINIPKMECSKEDVLQC